MQTGGNIAMDAFTRTYDRVADRSIEPPASSRLIARLRWRSLDRELIAGVDPAACPQLAARACAITSRDNRAQLAAQIDGLIDVVGRAPTPRRVTPQRTGIARNTEQLSALAALLRGTRPLYARGIAMLRELLSDGTGPVYLGRPDSLGASLDRVHSALLS